jgi:nucleoside phosphorylase
MNDTRSYAARAPIVDFAIITAIEVERQAVCKAFKLTDKHREKREGRVYWRRRIQLKNGEFYELVVAQSPDMANLDAALLTVDTLRHWQPEAVLMVGIAAAATTDQALGDLVLGKSIYYYERGKVTLEGTKPEPSMYPADAVLWNQVIALPSWKAPIPVPRPDTSSARPKIHMGVIASGEKVIADAAVRDEIASGHRKIMAIEMEGYGVSKAVWDSFHRARYLVIRAICDLGDASKNSVWHSYAAAAAAAYAKHFLLDRPLEPRNSAKSHKDFYQNNLESREPHKHSFNPSLPQSSSATRVIDNIIKLNWEHLVVTVQRGEYEPKNSIGETVFLYSQARNVFISDPDLVKQIVYARKHRNPFMLIGEFGTGKNIFLELVAKGNPSDEPVECIDENVDGTEDQMMNKFFGVNGLIESHPHSLFHFDLLQNAVHWPEFCDKLHELARKKILYRTDGRKIRDLNIRVVGGATVELGDLLALAGSVNSAKYLYSFLSTNQLTKTKRLTDQAERIETILAEILASQVLDPRSHISSDDVKAIVGPRNETTCDVKIR